MAGYQPAQPVVMEREPAKMARGGRVAGKAVRQGFTDLGFQGCGESPASELRLKAASTRVRSAWLVAP